MKYLACKNIKYGIRTIKKSLNQKMLCHGHFIAYTIVWRLLTGQFSSRQCESWKTFHREGMLQKNIAKEASCSKSILSKDTNGKFGGSKMW